MMEHVYEKSAEQGDVAIETPAVPLGKTLREARVRLGMSVAEVAAQTKFAPRQIEALEAEDYKHLPELAFVRGFVRSYAKILKLDVEPLLANLTQAKAVSGELAPAPVEVPFPDALLAQRQNLIWLGLALLLAVFVVVFAVSNYTATPTREEVTRVETPVSLPAEVQAAPEADSSKPNAEVPPESAKVKEKFPAVVEPSAARPKKPVVLQSTPQSSPTNSEAQPGAATQSGILRLEFDAESWVEIVDGNGNVLTSQAHQPGSDVRLEGYAPFSLRIGHAPSVRLYYQNKQVDLARHTNRTSEVAHLTLD